MPDTLTQTVEVPVDAIVEIAATMYAAEEILTTYLIGTCPNDLSERVEKLAQDLLAAAGAPELGWSRHPFVVAAYARSHELVAEFADSWASIGEKHRRRAELIRQSGDGLPQKWVGR